MSGSALESTSGVTVYKRGIHSFVVLLLYAAFHISQASLLGLFLSNLYIIDLPNNC